MKVMMNIEEILKRLDKHASEFNFPVLDNAYVEMASARMSAFRSKEEWAIAFEVLGFSNRQGIFSDDLYTFGSCVREEGFVSSDPVLSFPDEQPVIDPQTEIWIADWSNWSVIAGGQLYRFTPTRDEYMSAGIEVPEMSGPGTLEEAQLIRFFVSTKGAGRLFMSEAALAEALGDCTGLTLFLQTEDWQHPDVAGDEKPSMSLAIRSLLRALQERAPDLFQSGKVNTRWPLWASTDE